MSGPIKKPMLPTKFVLHQKREADRRTFKYKALLFIFVKEEDDYEEDSFSLTAELATVELFICIPIQKNGK